MSLAGLAGFAEGFGQAKQKKNDRESYDRWIALQEAGLNRLGAAPQGGPIGGIDLSAGGGVGSSGARPAASGGGGGGSAPRDFKMGGNQEAFVAAMMPHALRVAEQTGLDPRLIIAQAAQETGWGRSAPGNNYFGIKSHGKAGGNTMATNEVINGKTVRINDSFRGYGSMGESVDGYGEFMRKNPRYKPMLAAGNLDGQLSALGRSGYATDPNYSRSVGAIARAIRLPEAPRPVETQPVTMQALGAPRPPYRSAAQ